MVPHTRIWPEGGEAHQNHPHSVDQGMSGVGGPHQCIVGCPPRSNPPIGIANLRGKAGSVVAGVDKVGPLCRFHYNEIATNRWVNVTLIGWEEFPNVDTIVAQPQPARVALGEVTPPSEPRREESAWVSEGGHDPEQAPESDPEII